MTSVEQAARGLLQAQGIGLNELLVPEHFEDDTRWDIALVAELGGHVVALVRLTDLDGSTLALDQVSVHPAAARKGIGRALLVEVASVCRTRGYTTITGTTFRDVLFNGPFYSSLGAEEDPYPHPAMAARRHAEAALGLDALGPRIVMRLPLLP